MNREMALKEVKKVIKENYRDANHGIFNTRNISGDSMITIFVNEYFTVDVCYNYSYFEIFGTTEKEFNELNSFYDSLRR